jgi:hypothetical protein
MKLYRCNCNLLSPKKNNLRKNFVLIISNKIKYNLKKQICFKIIFVDPGGLLDEFKIIKKIFNKKKYKDIKTKITLIEELKNNEVNNAQKFFLEKINKKFKNIELNIKNYNNFDLEKILKSNEKNIFIGIDILPKTYSYFEKIINSKTSKNLNIEFYFLYSYFDHEKNIEKSEILKIKNFYSNK